MTSSFRDLGLLPELLETIDQLGYTTPTPIQEQSIPLLLAGHDVLGQAQTGTGKTAAFTLPVLQQLSGDDLQVLILAPTRELAIQVSESVYRYGHKLGVRVLPVYGGQPYDRQQRRLEKGVQVVVGTPGRTLDLIQRRMLRLHNVRFVVLDEADEMLKMGFIEDIEAILAATDAAARQTILFSATFTPEIRKLAQKYMRNPLSVSIEHEDTTSENVNQRYYMLQERDKIAALSRLLEVEEQQSTLIFARTKVGAAELAEMLTARGYSAVAIHGDLSQAERERILRRFRTGDLQVMVATDVMARGVDIPDVSHVINYDIPQLAIEYVHRIGRTARAGRTGDAITFVTPRQRHALKMIEKHIGKPIAKGKLPTREMVLERREVLFRQQLQAQIGNPRAEDFAMLDDLMTEGYALEQIAAALIGMARASQQQHPLEDIQQVSEKAQRQQQKADRPKRVSHEKGMVRLCMSVGRSSGLKPADVVYSIASKANIPGKAIGAIDIQADQTYLDVPQAHVDAVLNSTRNSKIRGRLMRLARA